MSWRVSAWARKTRGHRCHADKLVLMVLADYANSQSAEAWPSQATLAADCEMSRRNLAYCLASLEARAS